MRFALVLTLCATIAHADDPDWHPLSVRGKTEVSVGVPPMVGGLAVWLYGFYNLLPLTFAEMQYDPRYPEEAAQVHDLQLRAGLSIGFGMLAAGIGATLVCVGARDMSRAGRLKIKAGPMSVALAGSF